MERSKRIRVPFGILHITKDTLTMEEAEQFKLAFSRKELPQVVMTHPDTEIKFIRIAKPRNKFRFLLKTGY